MAKNNKVSMKQLRDATDVLMRFLEEYQTVPMGNSDAIVEYEGKVELIAAVLTTKKFATLMDLRLLSAFSVLLISLKER